MEFSIFIWLISSICYICFGIVSFLGQLVSSFINKKIYAYYLYGIILLTIVLCYYLSNSIQYWIELNKIIFPLLQNNIDTYRYLFTEVWYTIAFFRNLWPAWFMAIFMIALESGYHPVSARYRMMCKFNHNKLLIMVGALFSYFSVNHLFPNSIVATYFLSIALYTAIYYWYFGYATILHILKKNKIPYEFSMILLIGSIIFAQEYFMLSLVLCIGFGISDIWMDYHHRNASSMVFSLNFIK